MLNRLHLGRVARPEKQPEGKLNAFAPPVKPRPKAAGPGHGLPAWLEKDAVVLYRSSSGRNMKVESKSEGRELQVMVKQVTSETVKILFADGKTWCAAWEKATE